jgi:exonuclease SbcD
VVAADSPIRVLFLADTHLGFDLPFKPRVKRRRRGHDFFANFERALEPALAGEVDLVIHGGDLLYRSRVPPALVEMALAPLVRVAQAGVPVFVVPGNHERSKIPLHLWGIHPNLHIFHQPKTFALDLDGKRVALSGFPFHQDIREHFRALIEQTEYDRVGSDLRLLCIHAAVEGAQVGPSNYTFRHGPDVIPGSIIPGDFAAVLSGHIHRSQILTHSLAGKLFAAPVVYPGSIERTSFAERFEKKHYTVLEFHPEVEPALAEVSFVPLPTRPMISLNFTCDGKTEEDLQSEVQARLNEVDPDAVVQLRIDGPLDECNASVFRATTLRELAPPSMNVSLLIKRHKSVSTKS